MEKYKIIVPKDIRYVGQEDPETKERIWLDYDLNLYDFPHILNKKLTGCGFTEYCIKNKQKLILISPRKFLLENKEDQHEGEVYYVRNELETSVDYELDLSQDDLKAIDERKKTTDASENITIENLDRLKKDLRNAMRLWELKYGKDNPEHPFKILVTYDSFRHVKDALKHFYWDEGNHQGSYDDRFDEFQVVVDEFQSIFIDSRFKSDTEIELLSNLKNVKKVCFVSATPMLDKYLERLDEFKNLPYYEFDWETEDPGRTKKPKLEIRFVTSSLNQAVNGVIQSYKDGRFDTRIDSETGKFIESKEATLFLNSVAGICQAIRSNKLHLSECNVLCAQTTKNKEAVRRAFNDVLKKEAELKGEKAYDSIKKDASVIGKIPTRGQQHKMFTFCTRTVYLGADFYSTNARTFIFSDSNIACLSVDISMDLEQIIGRQRLAENPWKNTALMYVKTTNLSHKTTQEEFNELLDEKTKSTEKLLDTFKDAKEDNKWDLAKKYQRDAKVSHYRYDYVAVSRIENSKGQVVRLQPTFNQLVLITEQRAFELQQSDYADRFSVFSSVQSESMDSIENEVSQKIEEFNEIKRVNDKIRFLVEYSEKAEKKNFDNLLELIPGKYKDYFQIVGLDIIKAYGCEEYKIKKAWTEKIMNQEVKDDVDLEIYGSFTIGKRYSNKHVKDILNELYEKLGYKKKAKTTDLEVYYVMKAVKFQDTEGKWINGLEIIGKK